MTKRVLTQTFGVVGAILEKDGKILLVKEAKEIAKGMWSHPAGWIDVGENPIEAVKREVKEEAGVDFEPTHILGVYSLFKKNLKQKFGITPHPIKIIFIGIISDNKTGKLHNDVSETKWFTPEEIYQMDINTLRDMDIKKMVKDYFAGKFYPLDLLTHTEE
jgi:ADP-ribose pyrophosphatase YjhB (NUDIX family)